MDGWSIALLAVAGYVAITALVRLMVRHRNQMVDDFRRQLQSGQTKDPRLVGGLARRDFADESSNATAGKPAR